MFSSSMVSGHLARLFLQVQWVDDALRESLGQGQVMTSSMADGKRVVVTSQLVLTPRRSHHNHTISCLTSNQALSAPLIG